MTMKAMKQGGPKAAPPVRGHRVRRGVFRDCPPQD